MESLFDLLIDNPILIFIIISIISALFTEQNKDKKKTQKKRPAPMAKPVHQERKEPVHHERRVPVHQERKTYEPQLTKEKHERTGQKPVMKGPFEEPDIFKIPTILMKEFDFTAKEKEYEKKLKELDYKLSRLEEKERKLKAQEAQFNDLKTRYEQISSESKTDGKHHETLDENKIIEGVIWSEILGPPRAKKSYFTAKYR